MPDRVTLRALIGSACARRSAVNLAPGEFDGGVRPASSVRGRDGYVMPAPRRIEWERQADIAIDGFMRNGFFVMVNGGRRPTSTARSRWPELDVGFIKLTPLVGG